MSPELDTHSGLAKTSLNTSSSGLKLIHSQVNWSILAHKLSGSPACTTNLTLGYVTPPARNVPLCIFVKF